MSGVDLDSETLSRYLPDGPVSSLRRIETVYGAMVKADRAADHGGDLGEFGLYFTPGELDGFVAEGDEDHLLVTVRADLRDGTPTVDDVAVEPLTTERVSDLGYSIYDWGKAIDHSITQRGAKSGSSTSTVHRYCIRDCLQRWTNVTEAEPAIGQVAEAHQDGWVINQLGELGQSEETDEKIEKILEVSYPSGEPQVVATVAVRVDEDELAHEPDGQPDNEGYYYPGQLHVMNSGMKARKDDKLATKNLNEESRGESACMVTGEQSDVFGTVEDPLAFFTVQHAEKFPYLSKGDSWRNHPVSSEAAILLQSGGALIDNCSNTRSGLRVYTIPYFRQIDEQRASLLYEAVTEGDDVTMAKVYQDIREGYADEVDPEELLFYVIGVRNDSGDINVLFEVPNVNVYWPKRVAEAHATVVGGDDSTTFGVIAGFPQNDDWRGLSPTIEGDTVLEWITGGLYAMDTLPDPDADSPPSDDPREWLTQALLTGDSVSAGRLLEEYVDRLTAELRDDNPIGRHVRAQYAQFEALAISGLLDAPESRPELSTPPTSMTHDNLTDSERTETVTTDGGLQVEKALPAPTDLHPEGDPTRTDVRRYRLRRFIQEREAIQADDARRGAFLAGVLMGQLADHQSTSEENGGRGMNQTIRDRYPPGGMSGPKLHRLYVNELERLPRVYGKDVGAGPLFPETRELLAETFGDAKPDNWDIPTADLRFFYALGVEYGSSADYQAYRLEQKLDLAEDNE